MVENVNGYITNISVFSVWVSIVKK